MVPAARPQENCKVRGLVHFSAQNESNSREILGRKHGPDPFALDFAVLLGPPYGI